MKRRLLGTNITMPTEERSEEIEAKMKELVAKGVYSVGELLVPQEFESLSLVDGEIKTEKLSVSGRKNDITTICQSLAKKHKPYYRLHPDSFYDKIDNETLVFELNRLDLCVDDQDFDASVALLKKLQRQRHFGNWHDTSSISNHSHLLITMFCLFDKAVFYTDEEYFEKTGKVLDVLGTI
ncbi:uncharacterized protein LOC130656653 [Hydractinia symbiolongicarpus]|uniref:uncharacterized protein LOC130656653 n=1 Tax=Hydractinia symbiolongicarpus TaxID=13093 RepID=UPI002550CFF3|nr:uncharacterized protein LOC130656653 [Hydractinia symbiolongicarpus]